MIIELEFFEPILRYLHFRRQTPAMCLAASQYTFPPDTTSGEATVPFALKDNLDQRLCFVERKER